MACEDGSTTTTTVKGKSVTLNRGDLRFLFGGGHGSLTSNGDRDDWFVFGTLIRAGFAQGVVKASSNHIVDDHTMCRTGRLAWTASR
jgi:hypothetical protein